MPRTLRTIHKAINEACDEIIEAGDFTDTGTEVALCLLVNATMSYLEHSATDLDQVARNDYKDVDLPTLIEWIRTGPPTDEAPDDLMAVADAAGVSTSSADQVNADVERRVSTVSTGDSATDVPTTLSLVPPPIDLSVGPVIGADGQPRPKAKHFPRCAVWVGGDCTCASIAPKKWKGGGSRG